MTTSPRAGRNAVPDFGDVVRFGRLMGVAKGVSHDVLVLAAPSGYGKSVLAASIAAELFDDAVWIRMSDAPPGRLDATALVAGRLGVESAHRGSDALMPVEIDESEVLAAIGRAVRGRRRDGSLCVVLDDLTIKDPDEWLTVLGRSLRQRAPRRSLLLVTTRVEGVRGSKSRCVLGVDDLRLSESEAVEVAGRVSPCLDEGSLKAVCTAAHGQVALVALLARHGGALHRETGFAVAPDISGLVSELIREQLEASEQRVLLTLAMLQAGTVSDVEAVLQQRVAAAVERISRCLPLVRLGEIRGRPDRFTAHDIVCELVMREASGWGGAVPADLAVLVATRLMEMGVPGRALDIVVGHASEAERADWLTEHGPSVLDAGFFDGVQDALDSLPPGELMRAPLLLLSARAAADREDFETAARRSQVAARMAKEVGDREVEVAARLHLARVHLSMGRPLDAAGLLEEALRDGLLNGDRDSLAFAHAGVGIVRALAGSPEEARRHFDRALDASEPAGATSEVRARVLNYCAVAWALIWGRSDKGLGCLRRALRLRGASAKTREYVLGNIAGCCVEMGRLQDSEGAYAMLAEHQRALALSVAPSFLVIDAAIRAGRGDFAEAAELARTSIEACIEAGDDVSVCDNLIVRAAVLLGSGRGEEALADAEHALELALESGVQVRVNTASVMIRAAFLSLGDAEAGRLVGDAREWAVGAGAARVVALADLVLAEVDRRQGEHRRAIERLGAHAEYILTGSLNWYASMFVCAFPGLFGLLAGAVGASQVPSRLLVMAAHGDVGSMLDQAREVLSADEAGVLADRVGRAKTAASEAKGSGGAPAAQGPASCRVRLFGGLDIETPSGRLADNAWRKRKGRLIFAYLVLKRGQEVAREVLTDHLWPDMEDERARNNFHVVWSAMKGVLSPGTPRVEQCPYATHTRGVCRMTSAVRSDLDDFDAQTTALNRALETGDLRGAVAAGEELVETYRGELMPGEPYDDWFAQPREHYRHEFCSAMASASATALELGEAAKALRFAKAGLAQDPWREDLYQAALGAQIDLGQRSAAVETYFACRTRLVDDLGLDPSGATMRLYERVLAMEDVGEATGLGGCSADPVDG